MKGQSKYNCNDNDTVHVLYMYQDTISNDKFKKPTRLLACGTNNYE